jgi:GH24 family phage-related lysozyme (muramidase)
MVENHKKQWAAQVATRGPSYSTPAKGDAAGLSDALQTAISGNSLWGKGVVSSKMEDSASALIMAREGLRTTAYDDPAKGAGKNIGFGYNLNQRSHKEIERDFKRAGINFGDLEGIRSGKVKISSDQARLLLEATVPQYVKAAQSVANGAKAGMWDELSNSQKAVLVDLAYQLGPGKLQKFKQSFKALMSGTADDLGNLFMVNYTDQTGKLVPDTRGHALRSAMYSGGMGGFVAHLKTNGYLK